MDWLDSISYLPTFLDDPYTVNDDLPRYDWWPEDQFQPHQFPTCEAPPAAVDPLPVTPKSEFSKKRKMPGNSLAVQRRKTGNEGNSEKKTHGKGSGGTAGGVTGGSREARWAEQLLNPLSAAIAAGNVSRVQHLLYVLQELASSTGDANHRLAFYGLQALTRRLGGSSYAATEPRAFRAAVIKFHDVSPWFALPNCLANSAIMAAARGCRKLHVVDAGVSHGVQWPTMLEALTRRAGGSPATVRLTVAGEGAGGPFGSPPAGYDFGPQLVRYAKSIELDLRVERGEVGGRREGEEIAVVCAQFRAGRAGAGFLRAVRAMDPDLVVLSEVEEGEGEGEGFGRRAEMMWRFLESTSAAFKGRECEERRVVEGEAARVLEDGEGEGGGRERWRERMEGAGFREEGFGDEALEAGRGLLRKFDGNWEMRAASDGAVGLWWKGQAVSFCSLWKPVLRQKTRH